VQSGACKMIIGHYDHEIWSPGGLASYIRRVSRAQMAMGHKVHYFSMPGGLGETREEVPTFVNTDDELFAKAKAVGVDILHLHRSISVVPPRDLAVVRTIHGHQPYCPSGGKFFKRSQLPCDRTYSVAGCLAGMLKEHCGSVRPERIMAGFRDTRDEMRTLRDIPVMTVSEFLKRQMVQVGYAAEQIEVIYLMPPAIVPVDLPPSEGMARFVFLGRITPSKGLDWLVRAIAAATVPVAVDVVGSGDSEAAARVLVESLGIADRVVFQGWVDQARVAELIGASRALVFPSLWHEPGGTVAFEAMARGRAVVMSRVGGMPEVISDEVNGLLVEPNDIAELANAISRLAIDYPLACALGKQGAAIVADFRLENHMEKLMGVYDKARSKIYC
jgi:glycosyltransferase involved in cell wall biosynthesis